MLEPGDLVYQSVVRADEQRATVTGAATLTSGPMPIIDLTFRQQGSLVRVESRWGGAGGIRRGGERIDRRVWLILERCAKASVAVDPPLVD